MNVPKEMRETYEKISKLLIEYSEKYLNKEYEELCLHALEKLCRKRPSPLKSGRSTDERTAGGFLWQLCGRGGDGGADQADV